MTRTFERVPAVPSLVELRQYLKDKHDSGLIHHFSDIMGDDPMAPGIRVYTHLGAYHEVLFPELERLSEQWTKFYVDVWALKKSGYGDRWVPFRTFIEWHNSRAYMMPPETFVRVYIVLEVYSVLADGRAWR